MNRAKERSAISTCWSSRKAAARPNEIRAVFLWSEVRSQRSEIGRVAFHPDFVTTSGISLLVPEGHRENSPAFQRREHDLNGLESRRDGWNSKASFILFSRPFGTFFVVCRFPGVETPGYSRHVPPGPREAGHRTSDL